MKYVVFACCFFVGVYALSAQSASAPMQPASPTASVVQFDREWAVLSVSCTER